MTQLVYHNLLPRPYAALLRVSTKSQRIRGTITEQEREVRLWAERGGINPDTEIYFFKDDGVSGDEYIFDRPEGERLRAYVENGLITQAIVATHTDRINREDIPSFFALERLCEEYGLILKTILDGLDTSNEAAAILGPLYAAMARADKRKLVSRMTGGKLRVTRKGEWIVRAPYGHRRTADRRLVVDPAQAATIRAAAARIRDGETVSDVARWLNEQGAARYPSPTGKGWHRESLHRTLSNPSLYGEARYYTSKTGKRGGKHYKRARDEAEHIIIPCEPILARAEWEEVQRRIALNATRYERNGAAGRAFLLQSVTCALCGARYYGEFMRRAWHYYRHNKRRPCPQTYPMIPRDEIEEFVWSRVLHAVEHTDAWQRELLALVTAPPDESELTAAREEVRALEASRARVEEAYFMRGTLSATSYDEWSAKLTGQIAAARERLSALERAGSDTTAAQASVTERAAFLAAIAADVRNATFTQKRQLLARLVKRVTVNNAAEPRFVIEWVV